MSTYDALVKKVRNIKNILVSRKATVSIVIKARLNETYNIDGSKYSFERHFDNGFYVMRDSAYFMRFTWDGGSYMVYVENEKVTFSASDIEKLMAMVVGAVGAVGAKKQKTSETTSETRGVVSYSELYSNIESLLTEITKLEEVNFCICKIKTELYAFK